MDAMDDGDDKSDSATTVPEEYRFFFEDEVFAWDKHERLRFGLVMETYDATYSDSEMSETEEALKQGQVRVAWHPRGTEEVLSETGVSVVCFGEGGQGAPSGCVRFARYS